MDIVICLWICGVFLLAALVLAVLGFVKHSRLLFLLAAAALLISAVFLVGAIHCGENFARSHNDGPDPNHREPGPDDKTKPAPDPEPASVPNTFQVVLDPGSRGTEPEPEARGVWILITGMDLQDSAYALTARLLNRSGSPLTWQEEYRLAAVDDSGALTELVPDAELVPGAVETHTLEDLNEAALRVDLTPWGDLPAGEYRLFMGELSVSFRLYEEWTE